MPEPTDIQPTAKCAAQHIGPWLIETQWFASAFAAIKAGTYPRAEVAVDERGRVLFETNADGIGVIPIMGSITQGDSSFGGTSSIRTRKALRAMVRDPNIKVIVPHIDSPGGTVAGMFEFAEEFRRAQAVKPVRPHIDNLGASAAYWLASQGEHITAGPTAEIGSIGCVTVVEDSSGAAEMAGIKVHVISTGDFKGEGLPGTVVTDQQLASIQTRVEDLNQFFLEGVSAGRGMSIEQVKSLADGNVHIAAKAKDLGLIDEVATFDDVIEALSAEQRGTRDARVREQRVRSIGLGL